MEYQLITGDSFQILQDVDDKSVDLIVTDPPYESLEKHRKIGTTTRLTANWFEVITNDRLKRYIAEFYRVLKEDSHCYILCDQETHYVIREAAMAVGFTFKKLLIWDRVHMGMGYSWRACHEVICYLEKGKRKLNNLGLPDVLRHPRVINGYPTEKPVSLCKDLIENSSNKGDVVLDPFAGSGSTMEAALDSQRRVIGIELKSEQEIVIVERLGQAARSHELLVPRMQLALVNC